MSEAALFSELQAVLSTAAAAQQQEADDSQNFAALSTAMEGYYAAATQLAYLLDLQLDKDSPLGAVCNALLQLYQHRVEVLKGKLSATDEAQWVQLEDVQLGAGLQHTGEPSSASAATCNLTTLDKQFSLQDCQPQQEVAMLAGNTAGLVRSCGSEGDYEVGDRSNAAAMNELLQSCQRSVSGTLDDVVGLEEVKQEIEEAVFFPLQHPHLFKGLRQPAKTLLLHGPPGTGKTMLVEKVAAEGLFTLLAISPSMILSKWAGDSEKAILQVFELAQTMQPSILFLDEVDSIGTARSSTTDAGSRRLLTELLIQFNRVAEEEGVYVFAATNRMQDCDPALLRRFQRRISVPLPAPQERLAFFQAALARPELAAELTSGDVQQLADSTAGYSGSDLTQLCRLAAMVPVKELCEHRHSSSSRKRRRAGRGFVASGADHGSTDGDQQLQLRPLRLTDFQAALSKVKPAAVDVAAAAAAACDQESTTTFS